MSLARACLRLAAVAALRGVTLAQERVFDSRIGAIEGLAPEQRKPVIAIYTEEESGEPLSQQNGGPPFKPHVELVFEVSVIESGVADKDGQFEIATPETDAELEATLDTIEGQIKVALFEDMAAPLSVLFRKSFLRAWHWQSLRFREEQKGGRFAYRYVIVKIEVADEAVLEDYDPGRAGLDRLPPTFRAIARAWPDGPEKATALAMAEAFGQPGLPRGSLALDATIQPGADPRTRQHAALLRSRPKEPTPWPIPSPPQPGPSSPPQSSPPPATPSPPQTP